MCFGVTEPNSGLDTASLETRAERADNGCRTDDDERRTGRKPYRLMEAVDQYRHDEKTSACPQGRNDNAHDHS